MIEFKDVSVRRDGRILFTQSSFQLHPGQKIGLTGNNGTGKSTLFAVLLHHMGQISEDMSVDSGFISIPERWQVAHMAQEVEGSSQSAIDYVLSGDKEWFELNALINDPDSLSDDEFAPLYQRFDEIDGYRTPTKAAQIMAGLGFTTEQHQKTVSEFSGGWRMRLNLAKTLMSRAELMLLDEPTNHLDLDAILWLESWITNFAGLVMVISHDQTFLDATVDNILHIEQQKITLYAGNYSQFVRTRSERLAQQQQAYEKQQDTRAHLEDFIRRFRAKASKAKQAQSRIRQLERMAELSPIMADNPFSFSFYEPSQMSSPLIDLRQADIGYLADKSANDAEQNSAITILKNVTVQVTPDTRIGLLGMNGAGKSTLIKALVGDLPPLSGTYKVSDTLKMGYFNQHQMDSLDANATPLLMMRRLAGKTSDAQLRSFLGSFDFKGERIDTPSKLFSGGERARLTLALIVWQRPNVLVLDEPTNHLDLQMRQALTMALQSFAGAVVLVSHDRELIANVCDELYLVHDGRMQEFDGDISDYGKWLTEKRKQEQSGANKTGDVGTQNNSKKPVVAKANSAKKQPQAATLTPTLSKEELRKQAAELRQKTAPIRKRIKNAENALEKIAKQLEDLEIKLADTSLYEEDKKAELLALLEQQAEQQQQQATLEEEMLTAMTELEETEQTLQ